MNRQQNKQKTTGAPRTKQTWKLLLCVFAIAGTLTLLAGTGILEKADLTASDALYQTPRASEEYIVLIGIDDRALEELGPYGQWGRDIMALVLKTLNQSDECHPAAIGIDVLYTGETGSEADNWLAEEAKKYGNVIVSCLAEYGSALAEGTDGEFYLDNSAIVNFNEPYAALKDAAGLGHINAMLDADGILRHHLLSIRLSDGREIPSLALALTEKYRSFHGLEPVTLPPTDSKGFWYVPFCGLPGSFYESISVSDILSGRRDPDYFAEKIVLIGPYTAGLQDSYLTAIDHAVPMYGVEFQANAIQSLMWGDSYKREVGRRFQLILLFAVLALGILGFWRRSVRFSTALWVFLCGGYLFLCRFLYDRGWILHVLWIPLGVTLLYVGCIAFNYIQAALERRQVTARFEKYVAPEIVREILKEGTDSLKLGGKPTRIAVLFVDVRGFTSMSEKLSPEQVVAVLNRYLTLISNCIMDNKGTLDKFIGDAAMAFWGAPLPQEDYIMMAVRAAAEMVKGSAALSEELRKLPELKDLPDLKVSFGIGIHAGPAVVGNIGSSKRMDYTAIGDTVNTAERLEANAKGGEILLSRAVTEELGDRIQITAFDKIPLKGKKDGFDVCKLVQINDTKIN